jgi:hypothetical protein
MLLMRKILLLVISAFLFSWCQGQQALLRISKSYFRSDPFEGEFSGFLQHLFNDPTITGKILEKKTDTSLFYFQGTYKNFNPFFFKPKRVQVMLSELAVAVDSLESDTIYNYQLFAYHDNTKEGVHDIKKEFDKIFKRFRSGFYSNQYTLSPQGSGSPGETYNFFDAYHTVAPFALSWIGPTKDNEMCLILTIRMDNLYNTAVLPVPFYAPK